MSAPPALALLALLGLAAWLDFRRRQIPNVVVGAVVLLWLAALATGEAGTAWPNAAIAVAVLLAGIVIWRCGWLGGGDVKLIAALSLWAGPDHLASFLLAVALSGGLLALAIVLAGRLAHSPTATLLQVHAGRWFPVAAPALASVAPQGAASLPYGMAVALGGCWLVRLLLA